MPPKKNSASAASSSTPKAANAAGKWDHAQEITMLLYLVSLSSKKSFTKQEAEHLGRFMSRSASGIEQHLAIMRRNHKLPQEDASSPPPSPTKRARTPVNANKGKNQEPPTTPRKRVKRELPPDSSDAEGEDDDEEDNEEEEVEDQVD